MVVFDLPFGRCLGSRTSQPNVLQCVFNAGVFTRDRKRIWYGDLDLVTDTDKLHQLATTMHEPLYVLRERDARSDREIDLQNAVVVIQPDGTV